MRYMRSASVILGRRQVAHIVTTQCAIPRQFEGGG